MPETQVLNNHQYGLCTVISKIFPKLSKSATARFGRFLNCFQSSNMTFKSNFPFPKVYIALENHRNSLIQHCERSEQFSAFFSYSQHFSAFLSISQHFSAFLSISQHFSVFLSISQHFSVILQDLYIPQ